MIRVGDLVRSNRTGKFYVVRGVRDNESRLDTTPAQNRRRHFPNGWIWAAQVTLVGRNYKAK